MPCIKTINGIRIYVYSGDHLPPHIHALYGEKEALIDIRKKEVRKGILPEKKLKIVIDYVSNNEEDLLELFYDLNPHIERG